LAETAGINNYAFVLNAPPSGLDSYGLIPQDIKPGVINPDCHCCEYATDVEMKTGPASKAALGFGVMSGPTIETNISRAQDNLAKTSGSIKLEYWEFFTYLPPTDKKAKEVANTWYDQVQNIPDSSTFKDWNDRPCNSTKNVRLLDPASIPINAGAQCLWITVTLKNPDCATSAKKILQKNITYCYLPAKTTGKLLERNMMPGATGSNNPISLWVDKNQIM